MRQLSKISLLVAIVILLAVKSSAQTLTTSKAEESVAQLSQAVTALGSYAVRFTVTVGEYKASGSYAVGGERYLLTLGNIEVYGTTQLRYEVDKSRKEIVIDKVDSSSHNVLSNPLSAFDFIGDDYSAEILSQNAECSTLRLTPRQRSEQGGVMEIAIDSRSSLPKSIIYLLSGESIRVDIDHITSVATSPAKFDESKYQDFEIIDFR